MSAFKNDRRITTERLTLIAEIETALAQIVKNEDSWGIGLVEEMVGVVSNDTTHTLGDIEIIIKAILPIMSTKDLRGVHGSAMFHAANPRATERAA